MQIPRQQRFDILNGLRRRQSRCTPVYYVDLTLREEQSLAEAVSQAREEAHR